MAWGVPPRGSPRRRSSRSATRCGPRLLQELRFLLNYHRDGTAPVALILCGHTELGHQWALRPLEAIHQRVTVAYHLRPLTAMDAGPYVTHQLQQVGVDRPIFSDAASERGTRPATHRDTLQNLQEMLRGVL